MRDGQRIALIGVALSAALAILKILTGMLSRSSALLADGFESTGDVLASGLVWLGLRVAAKPADPEHPYGHGRAETLSGLSVGALLFLAGTAIAARGFTTASHVSSVPAAYAVWPLVVSIAVKLWLLRLKRAASREIGSSALAADAMNDAVDTLSEFMALGALTLTLYDPIHFLRFDRYGAGIVGMIMAGSGIRIAKQTSSELMDTMPGEAFVSRVREIARETPGVDDVEKIYARKTGLRHHVDLHVEVDPMMTVRASHELAHRVEARLLNEMRSVADVLVHIEPSNKVRLSREAPAGDELQSRTANLEDADLRADPGGDLRIYFEGRTEFLRHVTAGRILLAPGARPHPPHRHPEEEFMLVTEGNGEILCGTSITQVRAGAMMYCAGEELHGITNTGSEPMTFFFYKWLA